MNSTEWDGGVLNGYANTELDPDVLNSNHQN